MTDDERLREAAQRVLNYAGQSKHFKSDAMDLARFALAVLGKVDFYRPGGDGMSKTLRVNANIMRSVALEIAAAGLAAAFEGE